MGGSGGGSSYISPGQDLDAVRREIKAALESQEREAEVNEFLSEQLAGINSRDIELTRERLEALQEALADYAVDVDRLLFGGSVAKHTYVDGLSDVDALVVVKEPDASPADLVQRFADGIRSKLSMGDVESITSGHLAVTIHYRDGSQVQLLPAVERDGHTSVPSWSGSTWKRIRPHKFAEKLTKVNGENGNAVVPTIKLAKSLMQTALPEASRLSGYHIEAIAVAAFEGYSERRDRASMLKHLIQSASRAVLRPTGDITGQSVHIDSHLGSALSAERVRIGRDLGNLSRRLDSSSSASEYRALFGAD